MYIYIYILKPFPIESPQRAFISRFQPRSKWGSCSCRTWLVPNWICNTGCTCPLLLLQPFNLQFYNRILTRHNITFLLRTWYYSPTLTKFVCELKMFGAIWEQCHQKLASEFHTIMIGREKNSARLNFIISFLLRNRQLLSWIVDVPCHMRSITERNLVE